MATSSPIKSRPLANFHPTVWGYHFLSYTPQLTEITSQEKGEVDELKEIIMKMLVETPDNSTQKLVLIDAMQRLGVAYHFDNEIETSIQDIFDTTMSQLQSESENDDNLYVVSLRFRLLRQQGHYIPSDVFKQFIDQDGKFKETLTNDVQGLLSLYEASHLRVRDEEILEEAVTFTTTHLESIVSDLSNNVEVTEALSQPIRKTLSRVGARKYISTYQNDDAHNDLLLKFAKLDFNVLQKLHQRELSELTRWWKDLDFANKCPYARDRLVECYFWILGVYFEPKYSRARKMMTKVLKMTSIIDDIYDAYATLDELVPFTDAIQRWDISLIDSVPPYLRPVYQAVLDVYDEMEKVLAKEGKSDRVYYAKYEMKKLVRAYFEEAQWLDPGYTPTCEEHMENSLVSAGYMMTITTCLVGMEEFIPKETFEWLMNEPLIVRASSLLARARNDIVGHEDEQQRRHVASVIECYMKEYGASKQEAYAKYHKEVVNAWKDINKGLLRPTEVPMFALERVLNFARVIDTLYKEADGYTNSKGKLKNMINSLLVEPVKI